MLVGVGSTTDDTQAVDLMSSALAAAAADASRGTGATGRLLKALDRIGVPKGTWSYADPARLVAERVGADRATSHLGELGVSQQTLVSQALRAIASGRAQVAAVVGGEARAWARRAESSGNVAVETAQPDAVPDVVHRPEPDFIAGPEIAAGLAVPVQQYAMIDNALGHADGATLARRRGDIAALWSRFNAVAAANPAAAFGAPRSATEIDTPGPSNRLLAFPYNKWHASQWTVDQAGALLFCSAEAARDHGVPPDRWVFPLVGIDADHAVSLSRRRWLHRWPAMAVLGEAAAARIGRPVADAELVEVYSCFPSAVRVQQRELGLPEEGTPTLTGGMAFAGGPFNNFTYQATAALVPALRERDGAIGVVTTVCGLLTKPGLAVWSAAPDGQPSLLSDLGPAAAAATPTLEVLDRYEGSARVATYTVTAGIADPEVPTRVAVIADVPGDRRCVAVAHDRSLAEHCCHEDLIAATITVSGTTFTL